MNTIEKEPEALVTPFNPYEFQIWGLQAELEALRVQRKTLICEQREIHLQRMEAFNQKWFEDLQEICSIELIKIETGYYLYGYDGPHSFMELTRNRGWFRFKYLMKEYNFLYEPNDEFEDLDIHDFRMQVGNMDRDEYRRSGFVWAELEALVYSLVFWNRQSENMHLDIKVQILSTNMQLKAIDQEIAQIREKIKAVRTEQLIAGFGINFEKRKFYYKTQKFEFINNIKITRLSPSGKTCDIEVIYYPKHFRSTSYSPAKEVETKTIERVWMKTLIRGLWED